MSEPDPPGGVRVRFAPSPTGRIHVGNARTALYNWLFARRRGGAFIVRIEDTDVERNEPGSEERILDDLRWLGFDWDEGPDVGGPCGPYRQSDRAGLYREAAEALLASGAAYRCFCGADRLVADREAQRTSGLPPRYVGRCRSIADVDSRARAASGEPHVVRLRIDAEWIAFDDLVRGRVEVPGSRIGDPVLLRSDGRPAYNFAVVVDDSAMRITHVIRGEDHLSNTPIQVLLYRAMDRPAPAFAHLSMILGPDGGRLHKRHGAVAIAQFREAGVAPEALVNHLALLGWSHPSGEEVLRRAEMVAAFSLDRVSGSQAIFDPARLAHLNAHHIRKMEPGRLYDLAAPFLRAASLAPSMPDPPSASWWGRALAAVSGQMESLADAPAAMRIFFDTGPPGSAPAERGAGPTLAAFADEAAGRDLSAAGAFMACAAAAGAAAGVKGRALFHPLRLAFTGREQGPELDRLVPLIEEGSRLAIVPAVPSCLERVNAALRRLTP